MIKLCNDCDCVEIEKCSIRGYVSFGDCCNLCAHIVEGKCTRFDMVQSEEDSEEYLINKTINNLEKKILEDLRKFKKELLEKQKQKIFILQPK